ncbi:cytochrome c oxidase subunit 4 [Fodinicola acaciae]|uniref:cytochrome c oxidase subunit 4 n=1 Tax=Fodinicola acaciae TaxID=2681555 RepID=UPI0013D87762|nr:cytochrome c oxidase subunit 4 [Fodinicola acaciae]
MRIESRVFNGLALFCFLAALVYGLWTTNTVEHTEWVGVVALILTGCLCGMVGQYFAFVARRIDARPEDRPNADVSDGAGDLGFFSPGSYWPFILAAAAALAGIGVVFWAVWLLIIGGVAILLATGGLVFEYYVGTRGEH